ncbi:hypothetical protein ABL78_6228 [Leptomonas seymouri]|uniref:Amastin-like surface protein-like protein n=1 Tax=Leptomonas seymouri TaxID=5684 RepID=A0A0N0P3Z4_LEPSE|nr:hypothetical protein ABL78_6228 [Leptomonas seymouri]|eukprot:KPI84706.1 hypothetical protein ABL78_6228 [Leptomonas seymouri]
MACARVLFCILMSLFTACGACAALFPLMRRNETDALGRAVKREVSLWYIESKYVIDKVHHYDRVYTRNSNCSELRVVSILAAALNVVGCGLGTIASVLAAVHVCTRVKFHLCCTLMLLCFITFAVFMASLGAVIYSFLSDACVNDSVNYAYSYYRQDFKLTEGYILLCIATGGFFFMTFLEICS